MNDPIKNLSGQDIENLIELYRLERIALFVGQLRCWLSRPDPQITGMHGNTFCSYGMEKSWTTKRIRPTAEKGQEAFRFIRWQCKKMEISEVPIFFWSVIVWKIVDNLAKPEETQV